MHVEKRGLCTWREEGAVHVERRGGCARGHQSPIVKDESLTAGEKSAAFVLGSMWRACAVESSPPPTSLLIELVETKAKAASPESSARNRGTLAKHAQHVQRLCACCAGRVRDDAGGT
jgi:hypothetical protein